MQTQSRTDVGRRGEQIAASFLQRRNCRVIDRNFRTRLGELDIVFSERDTLVFCEVKTRTTRQSHGHRVEPLEAIRPQKQRQVRHMAAIWLTQVADKRQRRAYLKTKNMRFDVVGVTLDQELNALKVEHLRDAF